MPFSHHSHSGQFCGHATDTLEEVIQDTISKGMTTFCMTEHTPRERIDFYPGEELIHTPDTLWKLFDDYYHEARRLKEAYKERINLFVGFEGEWTPESSRNIMQTILDKHEFDLFVGSVHHVHAIPIDYDKATYQRARVAAGGSDERLFEDYFDAHFAMLQAMKPPVVGHFDLIRLFSDTPNGSFRAYTSVWEKIVRNLKFVAEYGGVLELNSSSLRKGMTEAYPQVEICKELLKLEGRFTLSDDSHGKSQVGLNYSKVMRCIDSAGIAELYYLSPISDTVVAIDNRFSSVGWQAMSVQDFKAHRFWDG